MRADQQERSEGARYWIASSDEWTKAGHWDPNRYGEGQGGWWQFATTSDTVPVSGAPAQGGETNGGTLPAGQDIPFDVGSYPHVQSPWGLLDVSGGAGEWLEEFSTPDVPQNRFSGGTSIYVPGLLPEFYDVLGRYRPIAPTSFAGIRLASVVPSPGASVALVIGARWGGRRRR